jgi:thiamine biosynthesis lipoprotein
MATLFEILICHEDQHYANQAAWEAFRELERLELDLSRFNENSDVARINKLQAGQSVRVGADTFECLKACIQFYAETGGVFDVSVGALMNCWLNPDKSLRSPPPDEIKWAQEHTGLYHLLLDETNLTVQVLISPLFLDFGGFGKGYAVDKMAALLSEWTLETFLIHGGTSSVLAAGAPPDNDGWSISISHPFGPEQVLEYVSLSHQAMSGSGLQKGRHIIDPRSARPIAVKRATWTFAPSAATCDALSTAFMILSHEEIAVYCKNHPDVQAIIFEENLESPDKFRIDRYGF